MKHKFRHWRYLLANGRARRGISNPRRERLMVRDALKRLGIVYHEIIPVHNPYHEGIDGDTGIQWLDFVCYKRGMFVILFDTRYRTTNGLERHQQALKDKQRFLIGRGTPCLTVGRFHTAQEYENIIRAFTRRKL